MYLYYCPNFVVLLSYYVLVCKGIVPSKTLVKKSYLTMVVVRNCVPSLQTYRSLSAAYYYLEAMRTQRVTSLSHLKIKSLGNPYLRQENDIRA